MIDTICQIKMFSVLTAALTRWASKP